MKEIEFIKSMEVLEVKEGDVLVVKIEHRISMELNKKLENLVVEKLPDAIKNKVSVFVLDPGVDLGILRAA